MIGAAAPTKASPVDLIGYSIIGLLGRFTFGPESSLSLLYLIIINHFLAQYYPQSDLGTYCQKSVSEFYWEF